MKKFQSFICIMLSGLLLVSSLSGFGMSVQATENATVDIPKYSDVDEYEVIISNSEVLSVLNAQEVSFQEGDKYYLSYTVETLSTTNTGTTFRSGIQTATATGKREKSPYTTGVLQYYDMSSISGSMVEPGYSYTVCIEVTANGNTYSLVKSDGTSVTSFKGVVASTTDQKYFGLCIYPGNISGKLTDVKCYDNQGNDLGVWGNKTYGVTTFEEVTGYEVLINNTTPMSVLSAKELAFAVGDKYYMSYTVESLNGPTTGAFITAIQTTSESGKSTQTPYTSGQVHILRTDTDGINGSMILAGYSYTLCLEVTGANTYICTVVRSDGTSVRLTRSGIGTTPDDIYFGLCAWGGAVTGKFTNVKCYDGKGNDLGVWGNTSYGVTAFEKPVEYDVNIKNSSMVFISNSTAIDPAINNEYYLTYTVEGVSTTDQTLRSGFTTSTDRTASTPYTSGVFRFVDAKGDSKDLVANSIVAPGYTYTIYMKVSNGTRTYKVTRSDGFSTVDVTPTTSGSNVDTGSNKFYFGLNMWPKSITAKLSNVKCYDATGNDLGVWGNEAYGVTVSREIVKYEEYDVNIKNSSMVFVSNNEAIDPTINNEYYLTYTVEGVSTTDQTLRSGFTTSTDRTSNTPYTSGVFRFVDAKGDSKDLVANSIVAPGYTYTIYMKVWDDTRTYKVTRSDGFSTVDVTPTTTGSNVDTGTQDFYFGLNMWPTSITAKLTNVKCYDAAGNDLGVWGNEAYGVSVRNAVDTKNIEPYDVYTYNAVNGFVGNNIEVPFNSGDKYYMSYVVEDSTSEAYGGIIATTDKTQQTPYLQAYGGMWLNQTTQGVLLDEGASYNICVTITDNKMQYEVMKFKDGAATSLTFSNEIGNVATKGKYYGIWIHGNSISKLTDVRCYDATGKDLGVYGNEAYGIQSVWKGTKIESKDRTNVFYDLNEGAYLVTGHNVKVKCIEGQNLGTVTEDGTGLKLNTPGTYVITRQETGGFYEQQVCLYRLGDVDLDGAVTADDVTALTNMLQSQGEDVVAQNAVQMAADLDNDNKVSNFDLELLTQVTSAADSEKELASVRSKYHVAALTYDYLGGDEVMPIAGYYGPYDFGGKNFVTEEVFALVKQAGVNLVNHNINVFTDTVAEKELVRKALTAAEQHGVGYFIDDSRLNTNVDITKSEVLTADKSLENLNTPLSSEQIANYVGEYSFYNSYLGTHLIDEPFAELQSDNEKYKYLGFYEDIASSLNQYSNMNGFINLLGSSQTQYVGDDYAAFINNYINVCNPQVLSFDVYPFANKTEEAYSEERMQTYFHSLNVMRNVSDTIPFWTYVQAGGDYRDESGTDNAETNDALLPNQAETLWNVNTALAYGAKGIEWFPLIQPEYFALDVTKDGGHDYDRNGLIGADKEATPFLIWATQANNQIKAADEILMKASNTGVLAVGEATSNVKKYTGTNAVAVENIQTITEHLKDVDAGNETWGALVGCFNYRETESYYVVNFDTTDTQVITLTLDGDYEYRSIQDAVTTYGDTSEKTITLTISAGSAALVVLDGVAEETFYNLQEGSYTVPYEGTLTLNGQEVDTNQPLLPGNYRFSYVKDEVNYNGSIIIYLKGDVTKDGKCDARDLVRMKTGTITDADKVAFKSAILDNTNKIDISGAALRRYLISDTE